MSFEIPLENLILAQIELHSQTTNGHGTAYMTSNIIDQFAIFVDDSWEILEILYDLKKRGLIK